jgi:Tfp pilus assembly protein PilV
MGMRKEINRGQSGTSLLETLIATAICTVVVFALAGLVTMAAKQSKNQGSTLAQSATLAAQKLDQLLGLKFTCSALPDCAATGAGPVLDTSPPDLTAGGSLTSNVTSFYDYLDATGVPIATGTQPFFVRRWQVSDTSATIKTVTVRVEGRPVSGTWDPTSVSTSAPSTVLASRKAMQ